MRPCAHARVDVAAAVHNCRVLRKAVGKRGLFAVVKADAYGHGLETVVDAIAPAVDGLCVFALPDAVRLRARGVCLPVLVMGGCGEADEVGQAAALDIWMVVGTPRHVQALEAAATKPPRVFVKAQTGMHRLGLPLADVPAVVARLRACGCADLALLQHFATADVDGGTATPARAMRELAAACRLPFSASNSAAALLADDIGEEFVRCGIAVYGCSPAHDAGVAAASLGLRPVMTLASEVIAVQPVAAGDAVGYGARWRARRDTKVAVVACGYANGYPRAMPDGAPVQVAGRRLPLAGRVSMEMLTVEVDGQVRVGDKVELWGASPGADELAALVDTIAYELLAGLPAGVPRISAHATGCDRLGGA